MAEPMGDNTLKDLGKALKLVEECYLKTDPNFGRNKDVVQKVVVEQIIQKHASHLSAPYFTGSSYESTGVPGLSDYDVQFSLKMPKERVNGTLVPLATMESSPYPDWVRVKGGPPEFLDAGYMSTDKVRQTMQGELQQALNKFQAGSYQVKIATNGPAITFEITADNDGNPVNISVDIVLTISYADLKDGSKYDLVAKPFVQSNGKSDLWRKSYSRCEKEYLKKFDKPSNRALTLYKILKVIKSESPQFKAFSTYVYKNAFMKLLEKKPQDENWNTSDSLAERFVDLVGIIADCLEKNDLPIFFNEKVNLLGSCKTETVQCLKNFLKAIMKKRSWRVLIDPVLEKLDAPLPGGEKLGVGKSVSMPKPTLSKQVSDVTSGIQSLQINDNPLKELGKSLKRLEESYLKTDPNLKGNKDFVQKVVVQKIIQPHATHLSVLHFTGSSYESTGVPGISDYGIQFSLKMKEKAMMESSPYPDWVRVKGGPPEFSDANSFMSTDKVKQIVQSELQQGVNNFQKSGEAGKYEIKIGPKGSAITLEITAIKDGTPTKISVDIVITISYTDLINGNSDYDLVAQPFNQANGNNHLWRKSFARKEKEFLKRFDKPSFRALTLYRILKVIKSESSQLKCLSTYAYKNAFMKLLEQKPQDQFWTTSESLAERLIDLIEIVADCLEKKDLTIHYNKGVNLLGDYKTETIEPLKNFLRTLVKKNNWGVLIDPLLKKFNAR